MRWKSGAMSWHKSKELQHLEALKIYLEAMGLSLPRKQLMGNGPLTDRRRGSIRLNMVVPHILSAYKTTVVDESSHISIACSTLMIAEQMENSNAKSTTDVLTMDNNNNVTLPWNLLDKLFGEVRRSYGVGLVDKEQQLDAAGRLLPDKLGRNIAPNSQMTNAVTNVIPTSTSYVVTNWQAVPSAPRSMRGGTGPTTNQNKTGHGGRHLIDRITGYTT